MEDREVIDRFEIFLKKKYIQALAKAVRSGETSVKIDYRDLDVFDPTLADYLINSPEKALELFIDVISSMDLSIEKGAVIVPRFYNLSENRNVLIRNIRSKDIGKMTAIEGLVRQASDVRPVSASVTYLCPSCNTMIEQLQSGKKMVEPSRCPNCGRKGKFIEKESKFIDTQRLVVEESPDMLEGGEQSKRISVFLNEDLVDPEIVKTTCPGSRIRITGIVKEIPIEMRSGVKTTRHDLMVIANNSESIEKEFAALDVTDEDLKEIKSLAKDKDILKKLVNSIAPTIWGYDQIKEAITMQLFSGVKKKRADGTSVRGDIHILLVGDPGTAKSQMLKYVSSLAPKARYVVGTSSTGAGITATVVKDEFLRGWSLEAGALVLVSGGIACIDEIDKMGKDDRVAMHEAMEQQTVSISKANIQATLRSETTILAAANPKLGRFDPYGIIADQIDLPPTLINRFDLIFTIRDIPDETKDRNIADRILQAAEKPESMLPEINSMIMKKYIAYAHKNFNPRLSKEAMETLTQFYVTLRNKRTMQSEEAIRPIPISPRQLEALVRLSEACARIRLSNTATKSDAEKAIELLSYCLKHVGIDPETGELDIDRIVSGIPATVRNRIVTIREIIKDLESRIGSNIPLEDVLAEAAAQGIEEAKTEEILDRLKRDGEVFEPKPNVIRRMPR